MLLSMSSTAQVIPSCFLNCKICTQLTFTCSKPPTERLEKGVKYV